AGGGGLPRLPFLRSARGRQADGGAEVRLGAGGGRGRGRGGACAARAAPRPLGGGARGSITDERAGQGGGPPRGEPALRRSAPLLYPAGGHSQRAGCQRTVEDAGGA